MNNDKNNNISMVRPIGAVIASAIIFIFIMAIVIGIYFYLYSDEVKNYGIIDLR